MKKNLALLSVILVAVLLLSSCRSKTENNSENSLPPDSNQADENEVETVQVDPADLSNASVLSEDEEKDLAKEKNAYQSPEVQMETVKKDEDIMAEAIKTQDPEKCNEIKDSEVKKACVDNVSKTEAE